MRHAANTLHRQWMILKALPRHPRKISTPVLGQRLRAEGFDVTSRSVQRDLDQLSNLFPISCDREGQTNHWYWTTGDKLLEIPAMDPSTALTLLLAKDYLQPVMPATLLKTLQGYFGRASEVLAITRLHRWRQKIRLIDPGPVLTPPAIDGNVRAAVYAALETDRCIQCRYQSRDTGQAQQLKAHPLGLVIRRGVYYLVCTVWDYEDPRHLALHRMSAASVLDEPVRTPDGFDLAAYLHAEQSFAYPYSSKTLRLKARFSTAAAFHLRESRLSDDQTLVTLDDDWVQVTAMVPDTAELRWWLLGFGDQVQVTGPASLRKEFADTTKSTAAAYEPEEH